MSEYVKRFQLTLKNLSPLAQGIFWFVAFKISKHLLSFSTSSPIPFFTLILQFILSMIIFSIIVALIELIRRQSAGK